MGRDKELTQDEVSRHRLMRLLSEVIGVEFASLWWVPDSKWKANLNQFTPREENAHIGLCLRTKPLKEPYELIPLLLGKSEDGPIQVKGVSAREPDHLTHFGRILRPGFFHQRELLTQKGEEPHKNIRKNLVKPRLDEAERAQARLFLEEKGLI